MARSRRRRDRADVAVVVDGDATREQQPSRPEPWLPWWLAAAGAALVAVAITWVVVVGLFALGWLATPELDFTAVMSSGTAAWLMGYFGGATIAGLHITMPPLGMVLANLVLAASLAGYAAGQARLAAPEQLNNHQRGSLALRTAGLFAAAHVVAVLVPSFFIATTEQSARVLVGAAAIGAVAGLIGASRAFQWRITEDWPRWLRPVPAAVLASVLVMLITGGIVLVWGLVGERSRIIALHESLQPDTLGTVLLVLVQLAWLPNLLVWCTSWALGAGFQVGVGSIVSPAQNQVGLLPTIPVLGAIPETGPGSAAQLAWLVSGLVAGAVGAIVVLRSRPRARFDETALVGGLVGVVAGLVLVALGLLSSGALGEQRLVAVGVRPTALFVQAPTLLGIAGVFTGAVMGLLRPVRKKDEGDGAGPGAHNPGADEPTREVSSDDFLPTNRIERE
ncbi:DUF6350 family protein [Propionibacteriaceae bacterium G1746]|uniref:cell division protein PerM n=1 Tax=Aestuariimicrobium sp. G57 TaxID=3418485 RepID=UPI003C2A558B